MNFEALRVVDAQRAAWRAANPGPLIWVTNCKTLFRDWCPGAPDAPFTPIAYHYIGRRMRGYEWRGESALANPFRLEDERDRDVLILRYRAWLIERFAPGTAQWSELMEILKYSLQPRGIALGCWCAPRACHGQVVKAAVESMYAAGWRPEES